MINKGKLKNGIFIELIIIFALISYLVFEQYKAGDLNAFFPNSETKKDYIKWVDFDVCSAAMDKAYDYDVESYNQEVRLDWIALLSYLGTKYGGDFSKYKEKDLSQLVEKLRSKEETMDSITKDMQYYSYYYAAYSAALGGLVGEYEIQVPKESISEADDSNADNSKDNNSKENSTNESTSKENDAKGNSTSGESDTDDSTGEKVWVKKYGLKAFLPIAKYFPYSDYDDFGVSRTYGYKRRHLGHDMMGQVGTPIIAVESGYIEALGWNQYGGWRIGIRSFDGKRYYYYAHLRKNFPYNQSLKVGSIVQAGDVIGYLGRTGYSASENVNNIDTPHLHFGLQLIFDESQKEGNNEIWIDCYDIIKFLYQNRSETVKNTETKEWYRIYEIKDPAVDEYLKNKDKLDIPSHSIDDNTGDMEGPATNTEEN